jgi:hypothetical protein
LVSLLQLILEFQLIISSVFKETVMNVCLRETVYVKLHIYTLTQCSISQQSLLIDTASGKCCGGSGPRIA